MCICTGPVVLVLRIFPQESAVDQQKGHDPGVGERMVQHGEAWACHEKPGASDPGGSDVYGIPALSGDGGVRNTCERTRLSSLVFWFVI